MRLGMAIAGLVCVLGGRSEGLTAAGRLTTSLYAYEGSQSDTSTTTFARVYQAVRLDLSSSSLGEKTLTWTRHRYQPHSHPGRVVAMMVGQAVSIVHRG